VWGIAWVRRVRGGPGAQSASAAKPIRVKVVVGMFERGQDTGDALGEYQLWVEREHLDRVFDLPAGYHHVRMKETLWSPRWRTPGRCKRSSF
jgi:hypothetical protein